MVVVKPQVRFDNIGIEMTLIVFDWHLVAKRTNCKQAVIYRVKWARYSYVSCSMLVGAKHELHVS